MSEVYTIKNSKSTSKIFFFSFTVILIILDKPLKKKFQTHLKMPRFEAKKVRRISVQTQRLFARLKGIFRSLKHPRNSQTELSGDIGMFTLSLFSEWIFFAV